MSAGQRQDPTPLTASELPYRIGVNLHVARRGRTMPNALFVDRLTEAGFRYVRIGTQPDDDPTDRIEIVNGLTDRGVECTWVFSDMVGFAHAAPSFANPSLHTAFENLNENYDGYGPALTTAYALDDLRRHVGWGHVKLIYPSTGSDWDGRLAYGPGLPYTDVCNLHFYNGAAATIDTTAMRNNLLQSATWGQGYQRKWLTENGIRHASAPPGTAPNDALLPDVPAGIALVRNALFAVSIPSVEKYAVYMFSDEPARYDTGDNATYGLVEADGTPKASYRMFAALFNLMADTGTGGTPASYRCAEGDNTVYTIPIAHSDGRTFVAFWQFNTPVTSAPGGGGQPWPGGTLALPNPTSATIEFDEPVADVIIHRLSGVAPPSTLDRRGSTVVTEATGDVQVLEVRP